MILLTINPLSSLGFLIGNTYLSLYNFVSSFCSFQQRNWWRRLKIRSPSSNARTKNMTRSVWRIRLDFSGIRDCQTLCNCVNEKQKKDTWPFHLEPPLKMEGRPWNLLGHIQYQFPSVGLFLCIHKYNRQEKKDKTWNHILLWSCAGALYK